jgi:hypothetical protein
MDSSDSSMEDTYDSEFTMPSGIPRRIENVIPLEDNADPVYRNVNVMLHLNVQKSSDHDIKHDLLSSLDQNPKQKIHCAASHGSRTLGKYQFELYESSPIVARRIEHFLMDKSISGKYHIEGDIQTWNCYSISDSCQLTKFVIRILPQIESVIIDFKRDRGSYENISDLFYDFQKQCGHFSSIHKCPIRCHPLPIDDDEDLPLNCIEIEKSIQSFCLWLKTDPIEALQCIGLLYNSKCRYIMQSDNILVDLCKHILIYGQNDKKDIIELALCLACLRKILTIYSEMKVSIPMTEYLLSMIQMGINRALQSNDISAKSEAMKVIDILNVTVRLENKMESVQNTMITTTTTKCIMQCDD